MYGEQTSKPVCFSLTPEVGNDYDGFWPLVERIIPQCFEVLQQNITAAKLTGSYFLLSDKCAFNISNNQGFLVFETERLGLTSAPLTITISGVSDHFTNIGQPKYFSNIGRLQKITDSISFHLRPGIVAGEQIKYVITAASGNFTKTDTITKTFGNAETVFNDNCSSMDNWESAKWNITSGNYVSPPTSITDSPSNSYLNNENASIILKTEINLEGAVSAWLTFNAKWALDGGADYVTCEISGDSGQTWNVLSGNYTLIPIINNLPELPMFIGKQTNWVKECMNLTSFCGNKIKIKFTIKTDAATRKDGFYFDDLKIEKIAGNFQNQEFVYNSGWHSLSAYLIPENTNLNVIFANNQNQLLVLQDSDGKFYQPGNPANTLLQWESQTGYMIKLAESTSFSIFGSQINITQLNLSAGWNLIPVITNSPLLISEISFSPAGSLEIIKEPAGINLWWPDKNISSLNLLLPGKSYLIKLKNDATLEFPGNR
jgi:hypothetical protein